MSPASSTPPQHDQTHKEERDMAMVRRNNNTAIVPWNGGNKQLVAAVTAGVISALQGAVRDNSGKVIRGVVNAGKRLYGAVRGRGKKKQLMLAQVGGMSGAITAPVAVTRQVNGVQPKFGKMVGSVTVEHREYLTQVSNSTGFTVNGGIIGNLYRVNPLNGSVFSWLPASATNYDEYTFHSVMLHYIPTCGTTEVGRVAMYFDKDSQDSEPADRVELANYRVLKETAPWAEAKLVIPTDRIKRFCDDSATMDYKLIDLGQIGIATYGGSGTNYIGDVFISYRVTLYAPQPTAPLLSTRRLDLSGAIVTSTGYGYFTVTRTSTVITMSFRSVGTFVIFGTFRSTGASVLGLTGGINVNSMVTSDNTGVDTTFVINCTVSSLPSVVTYTNTGITSATINCIRATRANVVSVI